MTTRQISTATWAGNLPDNLSYLAPTQFELLVKKLPNTKVLCNRCKHTICKCCRKFTNYKIRGKCKSSCDKITFGELSINFIVDENMENWTELYTWMEQTTGSTDPEKFRSLVGANRNEDQPYDGSGNYDELYSDMTIVVTTAMQITLTDMLEYKMHFLHH